MAEAAIWSGRDRRAISPLSRRFACPPVRQSLRDSTSPLSSPRRSPRQNSPLTLPQRFQGTLHAVIWADAVLHVRDLPFRVDQEVRADDAHIGLAIVRLLTPDAVCL